MAGKPPVSEWPRCAYCGAELYYDNSPPTEEPKERHGHKVHMCPGLYRALQTAVNRWDRESR